MQRITEGSVYDMLSALVSPAPVITLQTDSTGAIETDGTGALVTTDDAPLPDYPHLPRNLAEGIAAFDARIGTPDLPLAPDDAGELHPAIPASAESWIQDFLTARLPASQI